MYRKTFVFTSKAFGCYRFSPWRCSFQPELGTCSKRHASHVAVHFAVAGAPGAENSPPVGRLFSSCSGKNPDLFPYFSSYRGKNHPKSAFLPLITQPGKSTSHPGLRKTATPHEWSSKQIRCRNEVKRNEAKRRSERNDMQPRRHQQGLPSAEGPLVRPKHVTKPWPKHDTAIGLPIQLGQLKESGMPPGPPKYVVFSVLFLHKHMIL